MQGQSLKCKRSVAKNDQEPAPKKVNGVESFGVRRPIAKATRLVDNAEETSHRASANAIAVNMTTVRGKLLCPWPGCGKRTTRAEVRRTDAVTHFQDVHNLSRIPLHTHGGNMMGLKRGQDAVVYPWMLRPHVDANGTMFTGGTPAVRACTTG